MRAAAELGPFIGSGPRSDLMQSNSNGSSPVFLPERLEAAGLRKTYNSRRVVDGVSIFVETGEIVGLLGANGAGKTTTFYLLVGLERTESGTITVNGQDITQLPMYLRARLGIGYLPQEASVFRKLSAEQNILAVLESRGMPRDERLNRLEQLLDEFHLQTVRRTRGESLSGGERRRVEIARCLATDPKFILLDEPFAGIDPIAIEDIRNLILYLRGKGIGVLITDHNVRETLEITDRAYILSEGKVLKDGKPIELANDPEVRKHYLGERFTFS